MRRLNLLLALLALGAAPLAAADHAVPEKVAVCAACHGADGKATLLPIYPQLAGQYASYLEQALREYRDGTRKNALMAPQATTLTDDEIEALAAYYAHQPGTLHTPDVHKASAAR
jgi:cytochrome c553